MAKFSENVNKTEFYLEQYITKLIMNNI